MRYLADTVTIVRHFSRTGSIGQNAKAILQGGDRGEHIIFVSLFSLVEILYLSEKDRIPISLSQAIDTIASVDNYQLSELDLNVITEAKNTRGLELHDRLIVATARVLGVPMLTSDKTIQNSGLVEVIW